MCIIKGVALSDIHLGYRAYPATTEGRNTRECDVETAWWAAVDLIVERNPDLVTIAGDIFHHPRVGVHALKAWREGVRQIVDQTDAHVVVAMGNHDAGRTTDVLTPIIIPDDLPRVSIVTTPKRIRFDTTEGEKVSVAVFPFVVRGDGETYKLEPDPVADVNVLCLHAAVRGSAAEGNMLPWFYGSSDQALDVGREADRWDAIVVGDFHEFTRLHPTVPAFYSGAIERTSSDVWREHAPKVIVAYDTKTPGIDLLEIPTRPMFDYDLSYFRETDESSAETVNSALERLAGIERHREAIVRLKVEEFPREDKEHLDWSRVRELKSLTTHFYMDLRYAKRELIDLGDRRERPVATLADEAVAFFSDDEQPVRDCAMRYLDFEAEAVA